jgi:hypothetical protein
MLPAPEAARASPFPRTPAPADHQFEHPDVRPAGIDSSVQTQATSKSGILVKARNAVAEAIVDVISDACQGDISAASQALASATAKATAKAWVSQAWAATFRRTWIPIGWACWPAGCLSTHHINMHVPGQHNSACGYTGSLAGPGCAEHTHGMAVKCPAQSSLTSTCTTFCPAG